MIIDIYCCACKEFILQADTDTLKTPLVGGMFKVRPGREWSLFSPHDVGLDLTCPLCEWSFHENGHVSACVGTEMIFGMPEMIIPGILARNLTSATGIIAAHDSGLLPVEMESTEEITEPETSIIPQEEPEVINSSNDGVAPFNPLIERVQGTPEPETKDEKEPPLNQGAWSEGANTDENSELQGKAPPGTVATEPIVKKLSRKAKKAASRFSVG